MHERTTYDCHKRRGDGEERIPSLRPAFLCMSNVSLCSLWTRELIAAKPRRSPKQFRRLVVPFFLLSSFCQSHVYESLQIPLTQEDAQGVGYVHKLMIATKKNGGRRIVSSSPTCFLIELALLHKVRRESLNILFMISLELILGSSSSQMIPGGGTEFLCVLAPKKTALM